MLIILSGKLISVKLLQPEKANRSMLVTLLGSVTFCKLLHVSNVAYPMLVTP